MRRPCSSSEPGPFTVHTCFSPLLNLHRRLQTPMSSVPVPFSLCHLKPKCELLHPSRPFHWKSSPVPVPVEASCYNKASHCPKYRFSVKPLIPLSHATTIIQSHPPCQESAGFCQMLESWFGHFPPTSIISHTNLSFQTLSSIRPLTVTQSRLNSHHLGQLFKLCFTALWGGHRPFHMGHIRPSEITDIYIRILKSSKVRGW